MIRKILLLSIINCSSIYCFAQDTKQVLKDGLVLSYYLSQENFEEIEKYLDQNNYEFVPNEDSHTDIESYFMPFGEIDEGGYALFLDLRQDSLGNSKYKVGIAHINPGRPNFFKQKLKRDLEANPLFRPVKDAFMFCIPKSKKLNSDDWQENFNYLSLVIIKDRIDFYPPRKSEGSLDWAYYIPKYLDEIGN